MTQRLQQELQENPGSLSFDEVCSIFLTFASNISFILFGLSCGICLFEGYLNTLGGNTSKRKNENSRHFNS